MKSATGGKLRFFQGVRQGAATARFLWTHPSPWPVRLRACSRFIYRNLHKRIRRGSLYFPWNGMVMEVSPDSVIAAKVYYLGAPDWWEMNFLKRFLRPGDVCADVGANIGAYTLLAASLVGRGGKVAAFEPDPRSVEGLRGQVERNRLTQVEVVEAAVGDFVGKVGFRAGLDCVSSVSAGEGRARVPATRLDAHYELREKPLYIKVDVEGYEQAVVKGAEGMMALGFPAVWQLEVGVRPGSYGFSDQTLAALLRSHGYEFYRYDARANQMNRIRESQWTLQDNILAVRDLGQVLARLRGRTTPEGREQDERR